MRRWFRVWDARFPEEQAVTLGGITPEHAVLRFANARSVEAGHALTMRICVRPHPDSGYSSACVRTFDVWPDHPQSAPDAAPSPTSVRDHGETL